MLALEPHFVSEIEAARVKEFSALCHFAYLNGFQRSTYATHALSRARHTRPLSSLGKHAQDAESSTCAMLCCAVLTLRACWLALPTLPAYWCRYELIAVVVSMVTFAVHSLRGLPLEPRSTPRLVVLAAAERATCGSRPSRLRTAGPLGLGRVGPAGAALEPLKPPAPLAFVRAGSVR